MARDLYIVRHGNTFDRGDIVTRVGGRTNLHLSTSGREQAAALGAHFKDAGIQFSKAIAGPLFRTRETADAILAAQYNPPELEIGNFLREIDYGPDENQPEDKVINRIGQPALDAWETKAIPPPGWLVDTAALEGNWTLLFEKLAKGEGPALIVTSNGIARFALTAAGLTSGLTADLKLKTGAYGILHAGDGAIEMTAWNIRP